jgi:competence ComEA-like helix-hairpin-helix protein
MKREKFKWVWIFTVLFLFSSLSMTVSAEEKKQLKGKTVNINKVSAEEILKNVPLVSPELAKKIVEYRKKNGDFQTVEELLQVDGMTRDLLRRIKKFFILDGVGGKECTC